MQTACSIDQHHIGTVSLRTWECVKSHRSRIAAHLLLHHRHAYALTPDAELLNSGCTEGVCSTQVHFLASLFELPGKLSDGGCLAHTVHTYDKYHVRFVVWRQIPVIIVFRVVLCQQFGYLVTENRIQFRGAYVFVTGNPFLDSPDNLQGRIHANVAGDKHLFKIIQHIVINLRLASNGTRQFIKHTRLGFLQALIECFLLFLIEKSKYSHNRGKGTKIRWNRKKKRPQIHMRPLILSKIEKF